MTGIDVDALTRKYQHETAKVIHDELSHCSHDPLGDDCWYLARAVIPVVAARVEQDVREQIADGIAQIPTVNYSQVGMRADAARLARGEAS